MATVQKFRYFVFLVYPSSAPADWWERLRATHGMFACSPLHEPDEENKSPHYHVIYCHSNPVRFEFAKKLLVDTGIPSNGYVEPCPHPSGYMRYLVHLDDGEKQQFEGNPMKLIRTCNAFPLDLSRELTKLERREVRAEVINYIRTYRIKEYSTLVNNLMDEGLFDEFDFACNHTIFLKSYIDSCRWSNHNKYGSLPDNESYVNQDEPETE